MNFLKKINIFSLLIVVLTFSVMMRIFDISGISMQKSIAETSGSTDSSVKTGSEESATQTADAVMDEDVQKAPPFYGEQRVFTPAEVDVLKSLSKRREVLDAREKSIEGREALLKAAEGEVSRKIKELSNIKSELVTLIIKQKVSEDKRIKSLVKIYETMKPKKAARIFDTLDMAVLLPVLMSMSERKSSPILANMNPKKAELVTIMMAEQDRLPVASDADAEADVLNEK